MKLRRSPGKTILLIVVIAAFIGLAAYAGFFTALGIAVAGMGLFCLAMIVLGPL